MSADPSAPPTIEPSPGASKPDPLLVAAGVRRSFGGLVAVDVDHLEVERGSITALIGPNGAGKTTLFNLLTGFDRSDGGDWSFDDKRITGLPPHRVAQLGMVRTFQLTKALARMTVLDNMMLAGSGQRGEKFLSALVRPVWRAQEDSVRERAEELLARVNLTKLSGDFAGTLSGGQRKLLELVRALMVEPSLVMLDEPMAGVNPALAETLLSHITDLREEGRTVLFVEHDMDVVQRISDWVVVMAEGSILAEGPPRVVAANPLVIDAYLGHADTDAGDKDSEAPDE